MAQDSYFSMVGALAGFAGYLEEINKKTSLERDESELVRLRASQEEWQEAVKRCEKLVAESIKGLKLARLEWAACVVAGYTNEIGRLEESGCFLPHLAELIRAVKLKYPENVRIDWSNIGLGEMRQVKELLVKPLERAVLSECLKEEFFGQYVRNLYKHRFE